MANFKLWTNARDDNAATAFMSAIKMQNARWEWTDDSAEACLWCICNDGGRDISQAVASYASLMDKPSVACLSSGFATMPYPEWVYFRVPLNVSVLHSWLSSKQLNIADQRNTQDAQWRSQLVKLNYWPNVSDYVNGGSDIMMVCSHLLHGWCQYDELLAFNIDKSTLDVMLSDAADEGNLVYGEVATDALQSQQADTESTGLFKRIFSRFSK